MVTKGRINEEYGIIIHTYKINRDLLFSMGDYIHYLITNYNGKESEEECRQTSANDSLISSGAPHLLVPHAHPHALCSYLKILLKKPTCYFLSFPSSDSNACHECENDFCQGQTTRSTQGKRKNKIQSCNMKSPGSRSVMSLLYLFTLSQKRRVIDKQECWLDLMI